MSTAGGVNVQERLASEFTLPVRQKHNGALASSDQTFKPEAKALPTWSANVSWSTLTRKRERREERLRLKKGNDGARIANNTSESEQVDREQIAEVKGAESALGQTLPEHKNVEPTSAADGDLDQLQLRAAMAQYDKELDEEITDPTIQHDTEHDLPVDIYVHDLIDEYSGRLKHVQGDGTTRVVAWDPVVADFEGDSPQALQKLLE